MFLILMRLGDPGNFSVNGDCKIPGYEKWITLESVGFTASSNIEAKGGGLDIEVKAPRDEMQTISIDKSVDCSSLYLMHKAIQDRSARPGANAPTSAVIHFVENLPLQDGKTQDSSFPFLKIKLGNVLITNWTITGDGGSDRPSESMDLWFSQIAMAYRSIKKNGKQIEIEKYGPKGWDQIAQKDWPSSGTWADKE